MTAAELFDFLGAEAPGFGVTVPMGEREVFWNAYFRELHGYKIEALGYAMQAWRDGEFNPKIEALSTIFPTPTQLVHLVKRWKPNQLVSIVPEFEYVVESFKARTIPEAMRPRLSPQEVAARLRAQAEVSDQIGQLNPDDVVL